MAFQFNPYAFTIGFLLVLSALAIFLALIHSPRSRRLALFAIAIILALVVTILVDVYLLPHHRTSPF